MKRSTPNSPPLPKYPKMAPGRTTDSISSHTLDVSAPEEGDYSSYLSDVVVVGAGPSGLMLAYVWETALRTRHWLTRIVTTSYALESRRASSTTAQTGQTQAEQMGSSPSQLRHCARCAWLSLCCERA
jgi:hypothetical protein